MQQPRLDGPTYASSSLLSLLLASLPPLPLSAPLAQIMALPYVSDANRAPLVPNESLRRGNALFLHSSIPETPDSFSLLNHAFLREREGERSVEVYFFLFYLSSIFLLSIFLLSSLLFERILFDIRRCCVVLFWEGVWNCKSGIAGGRKPPNCGIQNGKALVSGQSRLKLVECVTRNRNTWH